MEREPLGEVVRAVGPQVLREAGTFGAAGGKCQHVCVWAKGNA